MIFDLDGTLADTFALIVSSWNAAVCEPLHRTFSAEEVITRFGPTECDMLRKELPPDALDRAIRIFRKKYEEDHARLVKVFDGVPEMLDALSRREIPIAVMTGKGRDTADITLGKLGWTNRFACVVTGDECHTAKPAPDGPLMAARNFRSLRAIASLSAMCRRIFVLVGRRECEPSGRRGIRCMPNRCASCGQM